MIVRFVSVTWNSEQCEVVRNVGDVRLLAWSEWFGTVSSV